MNECNDCNAVKESKIEGFHCVQCEESFCKIHYKDHNCFTTIPNDIRISPLKKFSDKQILFEADIRGLVNFKHERFGKMIMSWIKNWSGFHYFEESEDIMEMAEKCGLSKRVIFDPDIHGEVECSEPGDEIWWYGDD